MISLMQGTRVVLTLAAKMGGLTKNGYLKCLSPINYRLDPAEPTPGDTGPALRYVAVGMEDGKHANITKGETNVFRWIYGGVVSILCSGELAASLCSLLNCS